MQELHSLHAGRCPASDPVSPTGHAPGGRRRPPTPHTADYPAVPLPGRSAPGSGGEGDSGHRLIGLLLIVVWLWAMIVLASLASGLHAGGTDGRGDVRPTCHPHRVCP